MTRHPIEAQAPPTILATLCLPTWCRCRYGTGSNAQSIQDLRRVALHAVVVIPMAAKDSTGFMAHAWPGRDCRQAFSAAFCTAAREQFADARCFLRGCVSYFIL